jgi:predicted dehydrogenase
MDKIAVIGLGSIATRHRKNIKHLFPNSIVYAMSASGRYPSEKVSDCDIVLGSITELIAIKPNMVIVASPASYHAEHAIPLIQSAIPTLIEKPITAELKDLIKIQNAIDNYSTPVAVGYCLRYLPSTIKIKELLGRKVLGTVYNAQVEVGQYLPDWRPNKNYLDSVSANKSLGGGVLLELSHELDYANWLFGILNVEHAILRSSKELNLTVEDIADITLTTQDGIVCNIHLDFLQRSAKRFCSIIGSEGRLDWDLIKNTIIFSTVSGSEILYSEPEWDKNQMYLAMMSDFQRMIENKNHNCISVEEGAKVVQLISSIKEKTDQE